MPATIFSGSSVKALAKTLQLSNQAAIASDAVDPSSVPTAGEVGDLFLSTYTGITYRKTDSGTTTSWAPYSIAFKDPVANWDLLPTSDNTDGDVRITLDYSKTWVWNAAASTWRDTPVHYVDDVAGGTNATVNANSPNVYLVGDGSLVTFGYIYAPWAVEGSIVTIFNATGGQQQIDDQLGGTNSIIVPAQNNPGGTGAGMHMTIYSTYYFRYSAAGQFWTVANLINYFTGPLDNFPETPYGFTIVYDVFCLQSATVTAPGLVNTGMQTFGGYKTFNDPTAYLLPHASYNGDTLAGNGVSSVVAYQAFTAQTSTISPTALFTPQYSGLYEIKCYASVSATGYANLSILFDWSDLNSTQSGTINDLSDFSVSNHTSGSIVIYAQASIAVNFTSNFVVSDDSPAYDLVVSVVRLS